MPSPGIVTFVGLESKTEVISDPDVEPVVGAVVDEEVDDVEVLVVELDVIDDVEDEVAVVPDVDPEVPDVEVDPLVPVDVAPILAGNIVEAE